MQTIPRFVSLGVGLLLTTGYLALAAWGWGGVSGLLAHPARASAALLLLLLTAAVALSAAPAGRAGNASPTDRWIMPLGLALGLLLAWLPPHAEVRGWLTLPGGDLIRWVGVTLMALGGSLRVAAIWRLGSRFSGRVELQRGHRLETSGLYAHLRHPAYLGGLLLLLGWCLVFRSGAGLPLVAGMTATLLARIRDEEAFLASVFNEEYLSYQRRTRRLIPWLY
jgi:protein-S-isoprenylcysteine O-methyltransferase Ste14